MIKNGSEDKAWPVALISGSVLLISMLIAVALNILQEIHSQWAMYEKTKIAAVSKVRTSDQPIDTGLNPNVQKILLESAKKKFQKLKSTTQEDFYNQKSYYDHCKFPKVAYESLERDIVDSRATLADIGTTADELEIVMSRNYLYEARAYFRDLERYRAKDYKSATPPRYKAELDFMLNSLKMSGGKVTDMGITKMHLYRVMARNHRFEAIALRKKVFKMLNDY